METSEKQLTDLFEHHIQIRPRSLIVKIERVIHDHPTYWATRLLLTAKGYDVYDKIVFSPKDNDGYVIFACLCVKPQVHYHVLHFKYTSPNYIGMISVSFTAPYAAKTSTELVLQKPTTDRVETESDYIPPKISI